MIVSIIPDRYGGNNTYMTEETERYNSKLLNQVDVRRPTRGIQLKENTYAVLKLLKGTGEEIPLVNAGSRLGNVGPDGKMMADTYSNFLIQSVTEERIEKSQIVETFGEAFIFFYGQRPRVITIQGALLNTFDFNWEAEWWHNYENYLRGTKCVEQDARVYLMYDDTLVSGYIMSASSTKNATERNFVPFAFQLFVTDYTNVSQVGNPDPDQRHIPPESDRRAFRPSIVLAKQFTRNQGQLMPVSQDPSKPMSLADGLRQGMGAVNQAFSFVQRAANMAMIPINFLDGFIGNPIRIPVGFQGAVVFDETKVELDIAPQSSSPVQYKAEFGYNTDEFVVGGTWEYEQYASSDLHFGRSMDSAFSPMSTMAISAGITAKATKQFEELGLVPEPGFLNDLQNVVSGTLGMLASFPMGMQLLRSLRATLVKPAGMITGELNNAVAMAAPIVHGANVAVAGVAQADTAFNFNVAQQQDRAAQTPPPLEMSSLQNESNQVNENQVLNINAFRSLAAHQFAADLGGVK